MQRSTVSARAAIRRAGRAKRQRRRGEDEGSGGRSEVIVQADADDVAIELHTCRLLGRPGEGRCLDVARLAQIVTKVFGLGAPIGGEHPFEAAADGPAEPGLVVAAPGAADVLSLNRTVFGWSFPTLVSGSGHEDCSTAMD